MQAAQATKEKMSLPVFSLAASAAAAAATKSDETNPSPRTYATPPAAAWLRFFTGLTGNSPPGLGLPTAVVYPGLGPAISNTATGLAHPLYDDRVQPRCTGKERDAETNLDYFGFRHFSGAEGRFAGPDPQNQILIRQNSIEGGLPEQAADNFFWGFLENPQNWNRYTYVRNNPLAFSDPTGGAPVPGDGHHLIVLRDTISNPLARAFAEAVKTGGPNPPSNVWGEAHMAYNEAEQAMLSAEEQVLGHSDYWSLSQWKDFAAKLLNSDEPAIKNFLDTIERESPGARAKLAAAISAFQATAALRAQLAAWIVGGNLTNLLRMPLLIFIDLRPVTNPEYRENEEIKRTVGPKCLKRRDGTCVI